MTSRAGDGRPDFPEPRWFMARPLTIRDPATRETPATRAGRNGGGIEPSRRGSQDLGDLGEGQPGKEVEDDHRPVRRGEHGEGPLQRVPIGQRARGVIDPGLQVEETHLAGVSPSTIGLGVATQDKDPVEPLVEASRVTETGQAAPAADHRLLEGIFRGIWIAEDLASDREQVVANGTDERLERVGVA